MSIKSEGSTSAGRNRKSTASLGNELELENEGDANSSTFLDTSSSESGFAEDSGGLMSVNDERGKGIKAAESVKSQCAHAKLSWSIVLSPFAINLFLTYWLTCFMLVRLDSIIKLA